MMLLRGSPVCSALRRSTKLTNTKLTALTSTYLSSPPTPNRNFSSVTFSQSRLLKNQHTTNAQPQSHFLVQKRNFSEVNTRYYADHPFWGHTDSDGLVKVALMPAHMKLSENGTSSWVTRPGACLLTFVNKVADWTPGQAGGKFDWDAKETFVLNVNEMGTLLASESKSIKHARRAVDPAGAVTWEDSKVLNLQFKSGGLSMSLDVEATAAKFNGSLSMGELAVLKSIVHTSIPALCGLQESAVPIYADDASDGAAFGPNSGLPMGF